MAVRVFHNSITNNLGCNGSSHIRLTATKQRVKDTIASAHKLKRFRPCHRIYFLLFANIDLIVKGKPRVLLSLIILSNGFILLLEVAIFQEISPK